MAWSVLDDILCCIVRINPLVSAGKVFTPRLRKKIKSEKCFYGYQSSKILVGWLVRKLDNC